MVAGLTVTAEPPRGVAPRVLAIGPGVAVFVLAFLYRLPDATELINDHFMHLVFGRQLLWGRLPVRDAVSLGMPLQTGLSAFAEWLVGYRLLSEALIISTAFAAAAVLTFVIIRRATGSLLIAVAGALLEVAIAPRTYSYPKLVVYAAGIQLLWRYVDRPSHRRAVELGLATALAFYLRHDHGLYLGLSAVAVMAMRHRRSLRTAVQQIAVLATTCVLLVAPFFAYVEAFGSVRDYATDLRQFSARERSSNPFVWPSWPLPSLGGIIKWTSAQDRAVPINIRWSAAASDADRREAAARYHLQVPETGLIESGRFALLDASIANGRALLRDPAIEDTAGIDRATGEVYVPGWYVGPIRLLQGLDTAPASAALLFFVFLLLPIAAAIALARNRASSAPLGQWERVKISAVVIVSILTFAGFVREALDARIGDAVVAPVVLGAWLSARWLAGARQSAWSRAARVAILFALLVPVTRGIVVAGGVEPRVERADPFAVTGHRLVTSPPFDVWPAEGSAKYRIVRYVRECTRPSEPLLVLSGGAELYYYADRPFAGRIGLYMEGYYSSDVNQRADAAALERDRPAVAITEPGRETDLAGHPSVRAFLAANYRPLGELTTTDGIVLRVFGRTDRQSTSTHPDLGWPCYH